MICKNCGAKFNEKEAKCPFCGSMNEKGSKRLFFRKLSGITDTIEDLSERPKKVFKKKTAAALCVAAACILIGVSIILSVKHYKIQKEKDEERNEEIEQVRRIEWENETYPMLDEWYAKKDFNSIRDFHYKLVDENNENDIYGWKHYNFIEVYDDYYVVEQYIKKQQNQEYMEDFSKEYVLEMGMRLLYVYSEDKLTQYKPDDPVFGDDAFTEEELTWISGYKEDAQMVITDLLGVTKEEQEVLREECEKSSYGSVCYEYGRKKGW